MLSAAGIVEFFGVSGIFRVTNKRPGAWEGGCGDYELRGGEMANEKNLIPLTERGKEDAKRIRQMGQAAQTASRRRKRSLKEAADLFLSMPVTDTRTFNKMAKAGIDVDDADYQMAVIVGLTMQAAKGDAKAAKVIVDLLGEDSHSGEAAVHPLVSDLVTAVKKRQEDGHAE